MSFDLSYRGKGTLQSFKTSKHYKCTLRQETSNDLSVYAMFVFYPSSTQSCSTSLIFLSNVEFRTLRQTGGNSSEIGKTSDRQQHPQILTYHLWFLCLAACFWPSCPLSLQRGTIYKMGPVLFGRCPNVMLLFFFPSLSLSLSLLR